MTGQQGLIQFDFPRAVPITDATSHMDRNMFSSVSTRAASAYQRVGIETSIDGASPHHLVTLLFDALLHALACARQALARGDIAQKGAEIGKAVRILDEGLKAGLNESQGGEVAANLRGVYGYSIWCLTQANLKNDDAKLVEVVGLIEPVADAWKQMNPVAAPTARPAGA